VQYFILLFKSILVMPKWLPLVVAIIVVFVPNTFLLIKLFGGLLAVILFYYSITSSNNHSDRDLLE
jgi:hypothetical protein